MCSWVSLQSGPYDVLKLWECMLQKPLQLTSAVVVARILEQKRNFRHWLQASEIFAPAQTFKFLVPVPEWFGPLNTENHCIICTTCLAYKLGLWNGNQNFKLQVRPHHLRILGPGFSHTKLLGLRLHSPGCDQTWRERGRSGHAAFWIFKWFWQTRALENKVRLWPMLYCVIRNIPCQ